MSGAPAEGAQTPWGQEQRCRRCSAPVAAQGHAIYFSEHGEGGWLPLCPTHMNEAWDLLMLYMGGSLDVFGEHRLGIKVQR